MPRTPTKKAPAKPEQKKISLSALANLQGRKQEAKRQPLRFPNYAPGVLPKEAGKDIRLALDQAPGEQVIDAWNWANGQGYHGMWAEGIGFMGYPYLAELSQRSEYRQPCEVIAEEMTRKWITLKSTSKDDDKSEKIKQLTDAMKRFNLRQVFRDATELDGVMGISLIYVDLIGRGGDPVYDNEDELKTKLTLTPAKIGKGSLRSFKVIDPTWIAPTEYNANNPMDPTFYKPQIWFVMGKRVHVSRMMTIISRPVPDMLKPAYNFGGISLLQMMKPYVDNWLSTRQSVNDLISAFTIWNLATNMQAVLQGGGSGDAEDLRLQLFTMMKNNRGVMMIDKDTEILENISAPLGTLDHLQAQAQEHMAAPARIPLVKLFGITPSGLNASTDGEIRTFYDSVHGQQERIYGDQLTYALKILQLNEFGEIDPDIIYEFDPLWELDEAGEAAVRKTDADTDAVILGMQAISPDEVRAKWAKDPSSPYNGLEGPAPEPLDLSDMDADTTDPSERVDNQAEEGAESGANSGV